MARHDSLAIAQLHIGSLAGAVEAAMPEAFASYVRWSRRMLAARGIDRSAVAEHLGRIGEHLRAALAPDLGALLDPFLAAGHRALEGPLDGPDAPRPPSGLPRGAVRLFRDALLAADRRAATDIAADLVARGHARCDVYVDLFERALQEIGDLWEANRISVADEHVASAVAQYALTLLAARAGPPVPRGHVLVAGVEGERHDIGARMVADVIELEGWRVCFLGADVPTLDLAWLLDAQRWEVIAISATTLARAPAVVDLVRTIRRRHAPGAPPRIVVGGGLFRVAPAFATELGADACAADVREVRSLFRAPPRAPSGRLSA
jgi:methanogenic corrinoid protein MtbC1